MKKSSFNKLALLTIMLTPLACTTGQVLSTKPQVVHAADINTEIEQANYYVPPIKVDQGPFWSAGSGYRNGVGKPEGIVVHETATNASIVNLIKYEFNNWNVPGREAYVHAFVDEGNIVNISNTDLTCWGSGPQGNSRFVQVELCREPTLEGFKKSLNNDAYYIAYLLKKYNLPVTNATHTGSGTIWSHDAVTRFLGGTDHTDPVGYFNSWGYSMDQFFQLIQYKYNQITGGASTPAAPVVQPEKVASKADATDIVHVSSRAQGQSVYYLTDQGIIPAGGTQDFTGWNFKAAKVVKTVKGTMYSLLLSNKDGSPLAWIKTDQLDPTASNQVVSSLPIQDAAKVAAGSPLYYLYDSGFKVGDISVGDGDTVTKVARTGGGKVFYLVTKDGSPFAWVEKANVKLENNLGTDAVAMIQGIDAQQDKTGTSLPGTVKVITATPIYDLSGNAVNDNGSSAKVGDTLYSLGTQSVNNVSYTSVSFNGYDVAGLVPTASIQQSSNTFSKVMKQNGVAFINNEDGAKLYDAPEGNSTTSNGNSVLQNGSAWAFSSIVTLNDGTKWYNVGRSYWVKDSDLVIQY